MRDLIKDLLIVALLIWAGYGYLKSRATNAPPIAPVPAPCPGPGPCPIPLPKPDPAPKKPTPPLRP